ncbi:hypothetical protein GA0074696_4526 [Micromonospora purpureochromogenes]|uniref:O-antigen polysaccharide polymerase Wzy n=1 Tax=Micromonospora purpureochromogenes TaxID=47872 RepID=A0A1C4ZJT2_9ACTN|nr:hypothetical protein GA0074696_4526 [Micromonospora purpureochromogenes]
MAPDGLSRNLPIGLGWIAAGISALGVESFAVTAHPQHSATLLLSALALLFGLWVFLADGGMRITAVGVYNFSFALFVGFAALYSELKAGPGGAPVPILPGLTLCYFLHVSTWLLFWSRLRRRPESEPVRADPALSRWALRWGITLLALGVVLSLAFPSRYHHLLIDSAGFVGVVLLGLGLLPGRRRRRRLVYGLVPAAGFGLYYAYLFNDFGRIVLGSLGFALAMILANRGRGRRHVKVWVLAVAAPAVFVLGQIRATSIVDNPDADGLGSVVTPFRDFTRLLELNAMGVLPKGWGETFWAAAVTLVPRAMWPEKPDGLGAALVPILSPEMVGTGHTHAALSFGEWLINFGLVGLVLMVPITGLTLRWIDRAVDRVAARPLTTPRRLLGYTAGVLVVVGMVDLMWVGTSTYVSRTGCRLLVLLLLFVLVAWRHRPPWGLSSEGSAAPPASALRH